MPTKPVRKSRKPIRKPRKGEIVVVPPQVWMEVGPGGLFRWMLTLDGKVVETGVSYRDLEALGRHIKDAIVVSGGRAELVLKDRQGKIRKGPQGRDSGGSDPHSEG